MAFGSGSDDVNLPTIEGSGVDPAPTTKPRISPVSVFLPDDEDEAPIEQEGSGADVAEMKTVTERLDTFEKSFGNETLDSKVFRAIGTLKV